MNVEFTAQEIRNIFNGQDRHYPELDPLRTDDTVFVTRDYSDHSFEIYAVEPDNTMADPLVRVEYGSNSEFEFFNRYYRLRNGSYNPMGSDDE